MKNLQKFDIIVIGVLLIAFSTMSYFIWGYGLQSTFEKYPNDPLPHEIILLFVWWILGTAILPLFGWVAYMVRAAQRDVIRKEEVNKLEHELHMERVREKFENQRGS